MMLRDAAHGALTVGKRLTFNPMAAIIEKG
jgi:hypothetical protein